MDLLHAASYCRTQTHFSTNTRPICRVAVARCAYCMQEGESLYSIAGQWRSKWLDVWSGNPHIKNPGTPPAYSALRMGPIYRASRHDSVTLPAQRCCMGPLTRRHQCL